LDNISIVQLITCSYDNSHLVLIGLTRDNIQSIILFDIQNQAILAFKQLLGSAPYKIKAVCFEPKSTRKFITSGIQHLTFWTLTGRHIEPMVGPITMQKGHFLQGGGIIASTGKFAGRYGMALVSKVQEDAFDTVDEEDEP